MAISTISSAGLAPSTTLTTPTIAQINSASSSAPTIFANSAGTQIGTLCRAWVQFAGASGTIAASFNVSSVTRNGTGDYVVNFTNALVDNKYSGFVSGNSTSSGQDYNAFGRLQNLQTTSAGVRTGYTAAAYDNNATSVAIFR